ncbi:MAG: hypothetical protein ACLQBQ_08250 [Smithella sp.]
MSDYDIKRNYIRYPAESNELVTIYYLDERTKKPGQFVGIAQDKSFKGCCAVFVGALSFKQGQQVICECGTLPKMKAKVAWIRKLEDKITKVGFSLIE